MTVRMKQDVRILNIHKSPRFQQQTCTTTTFVCLLNPIRQTSLPHPYTIISLLSFHHCSSQPSQYLSVSSRAYTRLLNENIEKQRLSPEKRLGQSRTYFVCPGPGSCEFRIKRKESDWLFCKEARRRRNLWTSSHILQLLTEGGNQVETLQ